MGKPNRSKKRILEYDDDEDEIENTPIFKRPSTVSKSNRQPI